jgi:hypothetical protein
MPQTPNPATGGASQSPPASAIAPPSGQVQGVTPLSPQQPSNVQSGGGTPKQGGSLALSPGSPSETAPSTPGGGGKSLSDCMGFWEPATHMTKREWRAACQRTLGRIQ